MASPELRIVWRSELESFTQHKYFTLTWVRTVPLTMLEPEALGTGAEVKRLVTLRPAGSIEHSRFRRNVFAYAESHGLGQGSGGCAELPRWPKGSLMYEWGTLLCEDESAKVPNHGCADIERIIRDCLFLNPSGPEVDWLPGETPHDVGQNPRAASSIGLTQHTQITRASAEDFPLMAESSGEAQWHDEIGAFIDLVQVGSCEDAFFLQTKSKNPTSEALLHLLVGYRGWLTEAFGHSVDFNATCHPTKDGWYLVNIAPLAVLQRIEVPQGQGCMGLNFDFENPDLKERVTQHRLPIATVDCSHGKGNVLANNADFWQLSLEGRPMLSRLYDFNRRPGARAATEAYIKDQLGLF